MHIPEDRSVGNASIRTQKSEKNQDIWSEKPEPQGARKFKNNYYHVSTSGFPFVSFSAKNECHPLRIDGCQHFCHPGQESYICSCAKGYKLGQDHKSCIPHGEFSINEKRCLFPTLSTPVHTRLLLQSCLKRHLFSTRCGVTMTRPALCASTLELAWVIAVP